MIHLIVVPYSDNDFWYYMQTVGEVVFQMFDASKYLRNEQPDAKKIVYEAMRFVLFSLMENDEYAERTLEHLTSESNWGGLLGTNFKIMTNEQAQAYILEEPSRNNGVLVIDFRLPKDQAVYTY